MLPPDLRLENDNVLLRRLEMDDLPHLLPFALHEPETWHFSLVRAGGSEENLRHYIRLAVDAYQAGTEFPFIVFDKTSGRYAGSTRFYDIQPSLQTVQIGYTWYGKEFRGSTLNKNCKYLMLRHAFEELGMERVEFRADALNARSIAAMKSIGCKVDGILRSNMPTVEGDRRRDSIVLSILRNEWFSEVRPQLEQKLQTI